MQIIKSFSSSRQAESSRKTADDYGAVIRQADSKSVKEYRQIPALQESAQNIHKDPLSLTSVEQQIMNFNWQ